MKASPASSPPVRLRRLGSAAWLACAVMAAGAELGRPNLRDEEFIKRVSGAYGVLSEREPQINTLESALLVKIAAMMQENLEHARGMVESLLADGKPLNPVFNQLLGNIYLAERDWPRAESQFREAIRKFPDFQRAWSGLGTLQMEINRFQEAADALARSVELGASDAQTYGMLGYALLQRRQLAAAEAAYDLALLRAPGSIQWLEGKTRILAEQGRHAEVVSATDELLEKDPGNVEYWRLQANAHLALGHPLETIRCLEIARNVGTLDAGALHLLGGSYLNEGLPDRALDAYLAALRLEPRTAPPRLLQVAQTLLGQDQFDLARRLLATLPAEAAWSERQRVFLDILRARIGLHDGEAGAALALLEGALARDPLNAECLYRVAMIHAEHGRPEEARVYLEKVRDNPTYEYGALLALARLLIDQNQLQEALTSIRGAYRLKPSAEVEDLYSRVRVAAQSQQ